MTPDTDAVPHFTTYWQLVALATELHYPGQGCLLDEIRPLFEKIRGSCTTPRARPAAAPSRTGGSDPILSCPGSRRPHSKPWWSRSHWHGFGAVQNPIIPLLARERGRLHHQPTLDARFSWVPEAWRGLRGHGDLARSARPRQAARACFALRGSSSTTKPTRGRRHAETSRRRSCRRFPIPPPSQRQMTSLGLLLVRHHCGTEGRNDIATDP